jgi:hypothetical protein
VVVSIGVGHLSINSERFQSIEIRLRWHAEWSLSPNTLIVLIRTTESSTSNEMWDRDISFTKGRLTRSVVGWSRNEMSQSIVVQSTTKQSAQSRKSQSLLGRILSILKHSGSRADVLAEISFRHDLHLHFHSTTITSSEKVAASWGQNPTACKTANFCKKR